MASGVIMEAPPAGRRGSNSLVLLEVLVVLLPLPEALLLVAEPVMELLSVSEPFDVPVLFAVPDVLDSSSLLLLSLLLSLVGVALALEVFSLSLVLLAELSLLLLLFVEDGAWLEESS